MLSLGDIFKTNYARLSTPLPAYKKKKRLPHTSFVYCVDYTLYKDSVHKPNSIRKHRN